MSPGAVLLIIFGVVFLIIIMIVALILASGGNQRGGRGKESVLDLVKYEDHNIIDVYEIKQDLMTGDSFITSQKKGVMQVREKGMMKKPLREINTNDLLSITDKHGYTLHFHGLSVLNKELSKKYARVCKERDQAVSSLSEEKVKNIDLKRHMDKKAVQLVETAHKLAPFVPMNKNSSSNKK